MRASRRNTLPLIALLALGLLGARCEPGKTVGKGEYRAPLLNGPIGGIVDLVATIDFGQTRTDSFSDSNFLGFVFDAHAGAKVTLEVDATDSAGSDDPVVILYGPVDGRGNWGEAAALNDDRSSKNLDSRIADHSLTAQGSYLILVNSYSGKDTGPFALSLSCLGACSEPACPDLVCDLYCESGYRNDAVGCPTCQCTDPGRPCTEDADCPAGYTCEFSDDEWKQGVASGRCVPEGCDCPAEENPVCGVDGKTYANRCVAEECRGVDVDHDGPCECDPTREQCCEDDSQCGPGQSCVVGRCQGTDCGCTDDWRPVCGVKNGVALTYSNYCQAECAGAHVVYLNECPDTCEYGGDCLFDEDCPQNHVCVNCTCIETECACPEYWQPVCAQTADGEIQTYGNECEAHCVDARILYAGECEQQPKNCAEGLPCPDGYWCNECPPDPECPLCGVCGDPICEPIDKECEADQDCPEGYICNHCPPDPNCPGCDVCGPPRCEPGQISCTASSDCPPGFECVREDGSNPDCQPGDPTCEGICVPMPEGCFRTGCNSEICADHDVGTDCNWLPEYECLQMALCQRVPDASGNEACGWVQTMESQECLDRLDNRRACTTDSECGTGEFCLNGFCHGQDCQCDDVWDPVCGKTFDETSGEEHLETYGNRCEMDCAGAELAYEGECDNGAQECESDADCPQGTYCDIYIDHGTMNGYCVPDDRLPCSSNSDCPAGYVCSADGLCVKQ